MFTKNQVLEIEISDTADGQQCFGRLPDGLAVFVQGAAAVGDLVRASIFKIKKNYLETRMIEVVRPSPARVTPACAHFGVCGGCKWQHVGYPEQLRIKRKLVADALVHLGGFADAKVLETLPSPQVFGYRNKMEFSFGDRRYLLESEMASAPGRAGFIPAIADVKSALPCVGLAYLHLKSKSPKRPGTLGAFGKTDQLINASRTGTACGRPADRTSYVLSYADRG